MRAVVFALLALAFVCRAAIIPVHIPIITMETNANYSVPQYLGVFDLTVSLPVVWTLPLTYQNGGEVYPGQFLEIRNHGPYCLTLETTDPETIEGDSSYVIKPDSAVIILSNSPDWVVVSLSANSMSPCTSVGKKALPARRARSAPAAARPLPRFMIPVKLPVDAFEAGESFEVPHWLGAYFVDTPVVSNWTLGPTYKNGGQTYPGEFFVIRNYGPSCINLWTSAPETIEGAASFSIADGTAVIIMSSYDNWLVVSLGDLEPSDEECEPAPTTLPPTTTPVPTTPAPTTPAPTTPAPTTPAPDMRRVKSPRA